MNPPPSSVPDRSNPLTLQALKLKSSNRNAADPVENTVRHFRDVLGSPSEESHGGIGFQSAEGIYRAGAQGIPLSQVPQLPRSTVELTRLRSVDQAARWHLRLWAEAHSATFDNDAFDARWEAQGRLGGAEHHVYHDQGLSWWFKRLYKGIKEKRARWLLRLHADSSKRNAPLSQGVGPAMLSLAE